MRASALLVALVAVALATVAASAAPARDVRAESAASTRSRAPESWRLRLSPAPGNLAVAVIRLPARRGASISRRTLRAAVRGPLGADYFALAALRTRSFHARIAIALLVNRATALLDPAHVGVLMRSARALGAPTVAVMSNPFSAPAATAAERRPHIIRPWRCKLTSPAAFPASALAPISSRGTPLAGFGLTEAVAAAYDAVCGLSYPPAFKEAIQPPPPACMPGTLCCPPTAMCVPPPGELPPKCPPPCVPRPGYACPLRRPPTCASRALRGGRQGRLRLAPARVLGDE